MAYKAFLDTNIILDLFHADREFHKDALVLFDELEKNNFSAYYSESIVTAMAYILRKTMLPQQINDTILFLNKKMILLNCNQSFLNIAALKNPSDFEDALLYEIALHYQLDYFITSTIKDFNKIKSSQLPVLRAKDFNKLLS